jgi:hypothetical protein
VREWPASFQAARKARIWAACWIWNRFRGPNDRKDSLVDIFDPGMYTYDHPAWEAAPGTRIEMPALTSEIARFVDRNSEFADIAKGEIKEFRDHAETYADDEIFGLAQIAASALVDQGRTFHGREDAIRYLALNASAVLEDLWATDDSLWKNAPARQIQFDDMVAKRKADLLKVESTRPSFEESDFACYSENEIRRFAFDIRSLFLTEHAKHLAICTRCQERLESWTTDEDAGGRPLRLAGEDPAMRRGLLAGAQSGHR